MCQDVQARGGGVGDEAETLKHVVEKNECLDLNKTRFKKKIQLKHVFTCVVVTKTQHN